MIGGGVVFFVFFVCIFVFNFWRLLVKALFFPLFTPACLFYMCFCLYNLQLLPIRSIVLSGVNVVNVASVAKKSADGRTARRPGRPMPHRRAKIGILLVHVLCSD